MAFKRLIDKIWKFVKERGWEPYQKPRSLAISIVLEASELLEHFQWKEDKDFWEVYKRDPKIREAVADEIADVLIYVLTLCKVLELEPEEIIKRKLEKNAEKYPVSRGGGN